LYRIVQLYEAYTDLPHFYVALVIGFILSSVIFNFLINPLHNYVKYTLINRFGDVTGVRDGLRSINPRYNLHLVGVLLSLFLNMGFAAPSYFDTHEFKKPRLYSFVIAISGVLTYLCCFGVVYFSCASLMQNNVLDLGLNSFWTVNNNFGGYAYYAVYAMLHYLAICCLNSALLNLIPAFPLDMGDALYEWFPLNWQDALRNSELIISFVIFVISFFLLGQTGGVISNTSSSIMDIFDSAVRVLYGK